MTAFIGIDPGQTGGIAIVTASGILNDVIPMPVNGTEVDGRAIAEIISMWQQDINDRIVVLFEQVHSMPGQGVSSSFKFGKSFGIALGVVQALHLPMERVTPQKWKGAMGLLKKDKDASRQKATELWPTMSEHWKLKKQDGKAEAALIAEYGRRAL